MADPDVQAALMTCGADAAEIQNLLTNVRYCTLIQPTLLPRRGDQISTTAIVSTNPFTKL